MTAPRRWKRASNRGRRRAALKVGGKVPREPAGALEESIPQTGFFDEQWKFAEQTPGLTPPDP
jgi:hypothetical protein